MKNGIFTNQLFGVEINTRVIDQTCNKWSFFGQICPVEKLLSFRVCFLEDGCKTTIKLLVHFRHLFGTENFSSYQKTKNLKMLNLRFG